LKKFIQNDLLFIQLLEKYGKIGIDPFVLQKNTANGLNFLGFLH